jgi:hypothetical protein
VDVLNALNNDSYESVLSSLATSSSYKKPATFTFPRRAMLGAKFSF